MKKAGLRYEKLLIKGGDVLMIGTKATSVKKRDVLIENGIIREIYDHGLLDDRDRDAKVIDASNKLVTPGLVNAHTHSPLALAKGSFDVLDHPRFMWRNQADTANRTPREIYLSTLLSAIEMINSGTTSVIDNFPEQNFGKEDIQAVIQAYSDAGLRANIALRVFDKEYSDILPRDPSVLPSELKLAIQQSPLCAHNYKETLQTCEWAVERYNNSANGRISIMIAPSAPLRCTDEFLKEIATFVKKKDIGVHTHLLESKIQQEISQRVYGQTIVEHLMDVGLLNSRLSCAHSIWLTEHDIDLMAENLVTVVHCPLSNLKLGSGIAPIIKLYQQGVNVALGTDGASTNDGLNMLETIKYATLLQRCTGFPIKDWLTAEEMLRIATRNGATAMLKRESIGAIKKGKKADLVLFNLHSLPFTPMNNIVNHLIYCATPQAVDSVIVDGTVLMQEGQLTTIDKCKIMEEARLVWREIKIRNHALYDFAEQVMEYM